MPGDPEQLFQHLSVLFNADPDQPEVTSLLRSIAIAMASLPENDLRGRSLFDAFSRQADAIGEEENVERLTQLAVELAKLIQ